MLLTLPLGYAKGLSSEFTEAGGRAVLDLADGSFRVEVQGLPEGGGYDVWLVDNQPGPGRSVRPEPGDALVRLGGLSEGGYDARLQARLDDEVYDGFEVDLIVVTRAGMTPETGGLLFGSPTLFQRLYRREVLGSPAAIPGPDAAKPTPGFKLGPMPAQAEATTQSAALLEALVAEGEDLFLNETFDGNGRTCATCHPARNNFTIDPAFIATLPADDPLFVAEFVPELNADLNGGLRFENPRLMREFGLILLNVDGFDNLSTKFVMRGVNHLFNLGLSMEPAGLDKSSIPPVTRLGWGGDAAPGTGTLREQVSGAIMQHFTKKLTRTPGVDFRLATDEELDALEAFQLSLTTRDELDLSAITFKNSDVNSGKNVFTTACFRCHGNADANMQQGTDKGKNSNFDTDIENVPHPADDLGELMPGDGGFVTRLLKNGGGFGDGRFNTPPVAQAADTPPFFHNNLFNTIEEAVGFYASDTFKNSPAARTRNGSLTLTGEQIVRIAAFLRAINALENIRLSSDCAVRAQAAAELGDLCAADIEDGIEVLEGGPLVVSTAAVDRLREALTLIEGSDFAQTIAKLEAARNELVVEGASAQPSEASDAERAGRTQKSTPVEELPEGFELFQNYPNPFNPSTEIRFQLPEAETVEVKVFTLLGREIRTLLSGALEAGAYTVQWDGKDEAGQAVASGTYLYSLQAGPYAQVKKMSLVK